MKLYEIYIPYEGGSSQFFGPDMSDEDFKSICREVIQLAVKQIIGNDVTRVGNGYLLQYDIMGAMEDILSTKGFTPVKSVAFCIERIPESNLNAETVTQVRECYGESTDEIIEYVSKHEKVRDVEYQFQKETEQTVPVTIECEDAICKFCEKPITRSLNEDRFGYYLPRDSNNIENDNPESMWLHVGDGYNTSDCYEYKAEPKLDTVIKATHRYVKTDYGVRRVE